MPESQGAASALDELDLRVLAAIVRAPGRSNKALADDLGIAESTCAYRVRTLRSRGVLTGVRVLVDPASLGLPLQAVIRVRLGRHTREGVGRLFDAIVATPGVIEAFHVAGEDDFLVHVAVEDAAALRDIVLQHITVHESVRTTETHLVFERREGVGPLARVTGERPSGPTASDKR
ncbi:MULTISPECIES: Lrp/AsnC family transcriptional regulator [Microbacterium]|uniref:Lrp/AsnC family transcriptional regulator n=1 Tax=Microbacterium hominis TaxID=162426 RepID=A0A2K9DDP9_9MICO|nr:MULTISPECIES: Lrp/AsnC family transcriptional regulator [Microbacterium]AUG30261.1 Lrp/AsnC family transcriptional regulator [Microbacterium hominis]